MKHPSLVVSRFLLASLIPAASIVACSSSSGTIAGTPDSGHVEDAHKGDGAKTPDAGSTKDTGSHEDVGQLHDAGHDVGSYPGIDAALTEFGVSMACKTCLETSCPAQTEKCLMTGGCEAIEQCAVKCLAANKMSPEMCATMCIEGDASVPDGSMYMPNEAGTAAEELDLCFVSACPMACT